eukprot:2013553-Pyramimonas_sp.AAC.1
MLLGRTFVWCSLLRVNSTGSVLKHSSRPQVSAYLPLQQCLNGLRLVAERLFCLELRQVAPMPLTVDQCRRTSIPSSNPSSMAHVDSPLQLLHVRSLLAATPPVCRLFIVIVTTANADETALASRESDRAAENGETWDPEVLKLEVVHDTEGPLGWVTKALKP